MSSPLIHQEVPAVLTELLLSNAIKLNEEFGNYHWNGMACLTNIDFPLMDGENVTFEARLKKACGRCYDFQHNLIPSKCRHNCL